MAFRHAVIERNSMLLLALTLITVAIGGLVEGGPEVRSQADFDALVAERLARVQERIASFKGHPVVVNKWGSWCDPCRREFPSFQSAAKKLGNKVAFLGANVNDSTEGATAFLKARPLPYPSYVDDKLKISKSLRPAGFAPVTGFYDVNGRLVHLHAGPYDTPAALERDIEKYVPANDPAK